MILRLALSAVLLAVLSNCGPSQINSSMWPDYKAYQAQSHFRSFAYAPGSRPGKAFKEGVIGSSSSEKSVQAAIDAAMASCEAKKAQTGTPLKCRYYAIGNIEVSGLTGRQLDRAIAVYAENPTATNADLLANAAQAAEAQ